ncbi:hypothetical protein HDU76_001226, partial [Blyttiomyces sp. JEL0837]
IVEYCENVTECRHEFIMRYFGEHPSTLTREQRERICLDKSYCDICRDPRKVVLKRDLALSETRSQSRVRGGLWASSERKKKSGGKKKRVKKNKSSSSKKGKRGDGALGVKGGGVSKRG